MRFLPAPQKLALLKRAREGERIAPLCREAGVSRKTFYQWLEKTKTVRPQSKLLALADKRFKGQFAVHPLSPQERLSLFNMAKEGQAPVSHLCQEAGVSRKTFYKWKKRIEGREEISLGDLGDQRPKGGSHPRFLGREKEKLVLDCVAQSPQYSCRRLSSLIPQISYHGIQNILARNNLNTFQRRLAYPRFSRPNRDSSSNPHSFPRPGDRSGQDL